MFNSQKTNTIDAKCQQNFGVQLTREQVKKVELAMQQYTKNNLSFSEMGRAIDVIKAA